MIVYTAGMVPGNDTLPLEYKLNYGCAFGNLGFPNLLYDARLQGVLGIPGSSLQEEFVDLFNLERPSMPSRVSAYLSAHAGRTFDAPEIAKALGTSDLHLVRSTLFRLAKSNKIRKARRGQYGSLISKDGVAP